MSEVGAERGRTHPVMRSDERRDRERMIRHVWIKRLRGHRAFLSAASGGRRRSLRRHPEFARPQGSIIMFINIIIMFNKK